MPQSTLLTPGQFLRGGFRNYCDLEPIPPEEVPTPPFAAIRLFCNDNDGLLWFRDPLGNLYGPLVSFGNSSSPVFGGNWPSETTIRFYDAIVPAGDVDGVNTVFDLPDTPNPASSLRLFRNGLLERFGVDYTLAGNEITFNTAPRSGDNLLAFFRAVGSGFSDAVVPTGDMDGSNKVFDLPTVPNPTGSLQVFRNGLLERLGVDYSLSGSEITFVVAPRPGDNLYAFYRPSSGSFSDAVVPTGTINGVNRVFRLPNPPNPPESLQLFRNGLLERLSVDFTLSAAEITFNVAPKTGDNLYAFFRF